MFKISFVLTGLLMFSRLSYAQTFSEERSFIHFPVADSTGLAIDDSMKLSGSNSEQTAKLALKFKEFNQNEYRDIIDQDHKRSQNANWFTVNDVFFNLGLVVNDGHVSTRLSNIFLMAGFGKEKGWYVRGKMSLKENNYAFNSINAQIINYDVPGHYNYNTDVINSRLAGTIGLFAGKKGVSVFLGAGYGKRDLLYGINQFRYNSTIVKKGYVRMDDYSFKGLEMEAGILVKLGLLNLTAGFNTVQFKYLDSSFGLGYNF